jgi:hypothetical protein
MVPVLVQKYRQKPVQDVSSRRKLLKKEVPSGKSLNPVHNIMRQNELSSNSDEMGELAGFKQSIMHHQRLSKAQVEHMKREGTTFWPRNAAKLKASFLKNMNPANYDSPIAFKSAKERMKELPVEDFAKVLAAIMSEDEE